MVPEILMLLSGSTIQYTTVNYEYTSTILYLLSRLYTPKLISLFFSYYRPLDNLNVEGLVRLWAHEALRLFQDRLVDDTERQWTDENIDNVAMRFFPGKYNFVCK